MPERTHYHIAEVELCCTWMSARQYCTRKNLVSEPEPGLGQDMISDLLLGQRCCRACIPAVYDMRCRRHQPEPSRWHVFSESETLELGMDRRDLGQLCSV